MRKWLLSEMQKQNISVAKMAQLISEKYPKEKIGARALNILLKGEKRGAAKPAKLPENRKAQVAEILGLDVTVKMVKGKIVVRKGK